jgi:hypothetical protein
MNQQANILAVEEHIDREIIELQCICIDMVNHG